jgi:hypothetical protein
MTHTQTLAGRQEPAGDIDYAPYRLALDPAVMDAHLRSAHRARAEAAGDLFGGLWRGLERLAGSLLPHHDDHGHHHGPFGGHFGHAR